MPQTLPATAINVAVRANVPLGKARDIDQTQRVQFAQTGQNDLDRTDHCKLIVVERDAAATAARYLAFDEQQQAPSRCSQAS